ncbi:hypothetical protein [Roseococcus sp. YIM B11640]|uniref:hypothetical protein n=1 Tax=Roseococcus sp. YIM B11640 TaxID=3133973 RepID=UPI003C7B8C34
MMTQNLSGHVTDIQRNQILENLVRFSTDAFAVPSQFELGGGQASNTNALRTGIAPNIALRDAVAITGISLSADTSGSSQWAVSPITDVSDLSRLQLVYRLAVSPFGFGDFVRNWNRLAVVTNVKPADRANLATARTYTSIVRDTVGDLPNGPFVRVVPLTQGCPANSTSDRIDMSFVCFLSPRAYPSPVVSAPPDDSRRSAEIVATFTPIATMTPEELRSRFFLWISAASQTADVPPDEAPPPATPRRGQAAPSPTTSPAAAPANSGIRRRSNTLNLPSVQQAPIILR